MNLSCMQAWNMTELPIMRMLTITRITSQHPHIIHPSIIAETRHSRCSGQARASGLVGAENGLTLIRGAHGHMEPQAAQPSAHQQSSRHHCRTRHPGTADAAHRLARAGLQERNGPKPTRGARATRPATSQHRVGRRRRGSDERRRTLLLRESSWALITSRASSQP